MNNDIAFVKRLIAYLCVEGVFFSSSFCAIFYLKSRGISMYGLTYSNELISRDEALHCEHTILLYKKYINNKLSYEDIIKIFESALSIESDFICNCLPVGLIGMNSDLMIQYVKYVIDFYLIQLGYKKYYNVNNPFEWMNMISLQGKTNFFERNV